MRILHQQSQSEDLEVIGCLFQLHRRADCNATMGPKIDQLS